ncbi:MAG: zinc ribbon domain-containing protein [Oscillospiraceae bacterium]|nr:zinc ribbon domain-containing protein [Oscillospiraceae bacterium]
MFCNQCGTQLPQNSKFCAACGAQCFVPDTPLPPPAAATPPPAPDKSYMQKLKDGIAQSQLPPQPSAAPPYEPFTSPAVQEFAQKEIDKQQIKNAAILWLCLLGAGLLLGIILALESGLSGLVAGLGIGAGVGTIAALTHWLVNRIPKVVVHHYSISCATLPKNALQSAMMSQKSTQLLEDVPVPAIAVLRPMRMGGSRGTTTEVVVFAATEHIDASTTMIHFCAIGRGQHVTEETIRRIVQHLR